MSYALRQRRGFEPTHLGGILATLALHGLIVAAAVHQGSQPREESVPRDVVVAKLVRLGKPRPKELLPRLAEPAPVAAPVPAPVKLSDNAEAVPLPRKPEEEKKVPVPDPKAQKPDSLKRATDRARLLAQQAAEEAEGSPTGSPLGTADRAAAGDQYATEVYEAIRAEWRIPQGLIPESELKSLGAVVRIRIGPDGRINLGKITRGSGNRFFDDSITEVLTRLKRLPVPPPAIAEAVLRSGFELEFVAKDQR